MLELSSFFLSADIEPVSKMGMDLTAFCWKNTIDFGNS